MTLRETWSGTQVEVYSCCRFHSSTGRLPVFNTSEVARPPSAVLSLHHASLLTSSSLSLSLLELTVVAPCIIILVWLLVLLPPGGATSAGFLLSDFAVSRKAIPRAFFIFLPSRNASIKKKVPIDVLGLSRNFKVFFYTSEMTFMSAPLERSDQYGFKSQAFLYA